MTKCEIIGWGQFVRAILTSALTSYESGRVMNLRMAISISAASVSILPCDSYFESWQLLRIVVQLPIQKDAFFTHLDSFFLLLYMTFIPEVPLRAKRQPAKPAQCSRNLFHQLILAKHTVLDQVLTLSIWVPWRLVVNLKKSKERTRNHIKS